MVGCLSALCLIAIADPQPTARAEQAVQHETGSLELQSHPSTSSMGSAATLPALAAHVEESVHQEMRASAAGNAYVIVMLHPPAARGPMTEPERLSVIKAQQDSVTRRLAASEFTLRYQFKNFAGFTGVVDLSGLAKLAADPNVMVVGSDAAVHAVLDVSVPFIRADLVHADLGVTGLGVTVAVLDTGIDTDHPDLLDNIAAGAFTFLEGGITQIPGAEDDNGHGTNVSGIITSKGVVASVGVAPDADILAMKVLNSAGLGNLTDSVRAIDYVVSHRSDYANLCAINMSLSSDQLFSACPCDNSSAFNQLMQAAVQAARNVGILTFVATGNDGSCGSMGSPACLSSTVAVAAVFDSSSGVPDRVTSFSNRSGCNDFAAPGFGIEAPGRGGGTSNFTGTSQATPHVAGVIALMCSRCGPGFSATGIMLETLRSTGVTTTESCAITPRPIRVDAFAAVDAITTICVEGPAFGQLPFCECDSDIDRDGNIETIDVEAVQNCVAGDCSGCVASCDVDCDGDVDSEDVDAVSCRLAGDPASLCCPTASGESIVSNVDWGDHLPNVAVADDFVSDGRPITGVRWWGSALSAPTCEQPAIAGEDCWSTMCDGNTVVTFGSASVPVIPAGWFGSGSDPFSGTVTLGGASGFADTRVVRLDDMCFAGALPVADHTSIQLTQLDLRSCDPITVTFNGGQTPTAFDVVVSAAAVQPVGDLWATKTDANGGSYDSTLPVELVVEFNGDGAVVGPLQIALTLDALALPWVQAQPDTAACGLGGGFFPGYDPSQTTCCDESCQTGPEPGHDHCGRPAGCPACSTGGPACPGSGDCCDIAGNGTTSCSDAECCEAVCAVDVFCCDVTWDTACALQAKELCISCAAPVAPIASGEVVSQTGVVEPNWDGWFLSFHIPNGEGISSPDAYARDDGGHEMSIGFTDDSDLIWLNQFDVIAGLETVNSIRLAWGFVPVGMPAQVMLYDDPNNDGDPSDAVLLVVEDTVTENADTGIFTTVAIPNTNVGTAGDSFFVGAVITQGPGEFPAAIDTVPGSQRRSWIGGGDAGTADIQDLSNNALPISLLDDVDESRAGNWLLRAGVLLAPEDQVDALAVYYCDRDIVGIKPSGLTTCEEQPVDEYRAELDECCLVHSSMDPRTGLSPGGRNAFFEDECSRYLIDIEAVVGRRFVFDPISTRCIEQPTGNSMEGAFWGWHTAPQDSGSAPAIAAPVTIDDGRCFSGTNDNNSCTITTDCPGGQCDGSLLYGPWTEVDSACASPNMAFELITRTPSDIPDCNNNHIPDQCETDCQPNGIPDDCDIDGGGSPDSDGNGIPDECECCVSSPPNDVKIPDSTTGSPLTTLTTNRTLIVQLDDDAGCDLQAIRVIYKDLAPPYDVWNGAQLWLGAPFETSELGASTDATPPTNSWSLLQCTPECRGDWSTFGELHVYHEGIVPGSTYEFQVVDCSATGCMAEESIFSPPLELGTSAYGDTVRDCEVFPCAPPEGAPINVADALAVLDAFVSSPGAPRKARADLEPRTLDRRINVSDALQALRGFSGLTYPFSPSSVGPCP